MVGTYRAELQHEGYIEDTIFSDLRNGKEELIISFDTFSIKFLPGGRFEVIDASKLA